MWSERIFCIMKCWSTKSQIAIIMYADWSTQWSKSDTVHNKCNIFSVTFFKNTFQNVSFNISIYRMFEWWPLHPFPLHNKFTADWFLLFDFLVLQKNLHIEQVGPSTHDFDLYLASAWFEFWPGQWWPWLTMLVVIFSPSRQIMW